MSSSIALISFGTPAHLSFRALPERKKRVCKSLTPEEDPFCLTEVPLSQACGAPPAPHHVAACFIDVRTNTKKRDGPPRQQNN